MDHHWHDGIFPHWHMGGFWIVVIFAVVLVWLVYRNFNQRKK